MSDPRLDRLVQRARGADVRAEVAARAVSAIERNARLAASVERAPRRSFAAALAFGLAVCAAIVVWLVRPPSTTSDAVSPWPAPAGGIAELSAIDASAPALPQPLPLPVQPSPQPMPMPMPVPTPPRVPHPAHVEPAPPDPTPAPAPAPALSIKDRWHHARSLRAGGDYAGAIAECIAIADAADATWSPIAELEAVRIYLGPLAAPERAIDVADRILREWPSAPLAAEARELRCRARSQLGRSCS